MDKVELRLSNLMAFDARAVGNWGCPPEYYGAALDLVLDGKVQVAPFVEQHPLSTDQRQFSTRCTSTRFASGSCWCPTEAAHPRQSTPKETL